MGDLNKFVERMLYWCNQGNLGYDQGNRWDIRYGGECDCSSLVIFALREAGFDTGSASYTGDMSANLTARGWTRLSPSGTPKVGDILLNDGHHVAVCTGANQMSYASIDERGKISGGQSGDQTDKETKTVSGFNYSRGWSCYLRYTGSGQNQSENVADVTSGGEEEVYNFALVKNGSKGDAVKVCQAALNVRNGAGLHVDGECGSLTASAIKKWQSAHGLEVDGQCGQKTWQSLLGK